MDRPDAKLGQVRRTAKLLLHVAAVDAALRLAVLAHHHHHLSLIPHGARHRLIASRFDGGPPRARNEAVAVAAHSLVRQP